MKILLVKIIVLMILLELDKKQTYQHICLVDLCFKIIMNKLISYINSY